MKHYSLFFCLLFVCQIVLGNYSISGHITDSKTQEILPYTSVFLPIQNTGTITDQQGQFKITNLPKGKIIVKVSHIGYKTVIKTILLDSKEYKIDFQLEPSFLHSEDIVITSGLYSTQHNNTINTDYINNLSEHPSPSFGPILSKIPGVDVISKGVGISTPVIRGLSRTNIVVLNNGVKLENFQFSENHPFIVNEIGVDHIEIIKGPASLLYGSNAVGGVINVIKEKPAPINTIQGNYTTQFHSNTLGTMHNLGVKGSRKALFWGVRLGYSSHQDYKDGSDHFVPNSRFNEYSAKANIGLRKNYGIFKFYYDFNQPKYGLTIPAVKPLMNNNKRKSEYWYQDLSNHLFSSQNTLFLGTYKLDINGAYQHNNRKLQTDFSKPQFAMVDMNLNTLSYEMKLHFPSTEKSNYIIGIQGANKENQNQKAPNHVIPNAKVNDAAAFGFVQYHLTPRIMCQGGARYDYRSISTSKEDHKEAVNTTYNNFGGSLGATLKINNDWLLRANFASAHRTPNIAELTTNGIHGARYEQGNANLKLQQNYEMDISTHYHNQTTIINLSLFYNAIDNYIYLAPTNKVTSNQIKIYQYTQAKATLYGGEVSIDYSPYNWFSLYSQFAYVIGKEDNGENLPFIPQHKLKYGIQLKKNKWGPLMKPHINIDCINALSQENPARFETKTDHYFLLNASIGSSFSCYKQKIHWSIQANNILNTKYYDHLSTVKDLGYYNMGRNISASLTIPFSIKNK